MGYIFTTPDSFRFLPPKYDFYRWYDSYGNVNQIIDSQVADVSSTMTNFGTQTDVTQTATSNQVSMPAIPPIL